MSCSAPPGTRGCDASTRDTSPSSAYRFARSSTAARDGPLGVERLLRFFPLDSQGVFDFALLGQQLDLFRSSRLVAAALVGFQLRKTGLNRGERLKLLKRDRDGLRLERLGVAAGGGAAGGVAAAAAATWVTGVV